jgi:hypothetical protein
MNDVRSILFKVKLAGHGVVNFDSGDQKFTWNALVSQGEKSRFDNVQFAKKRWYKNDQKDKNGDDIFDYKLVISADCLRHNVFVDDFLYQSPNVFSHPDLLYKMIATPSAVLRGYFFAREGKTSFKRKSSITITEAEQTNNAISTIETFSRSGKKEERDQETDTGDTTFFKRECVGEMTYEAMGAIDLRELQFVSMSELYDRLAVLPDDFDVYYRPILEKHLNSKLEKPGYFVIRSSAICTPEFGFAFTSDQQQALVREFFKRLLRTQVTKSAGGYAHVTEVKIKYVRDPLVDRVDSSEGWKALSKEADVEFLPFSFYEQYDHAKAIEIIKVQDEAIKKAKAEGKEKKLEEKKVKAEAKEARAKAQKA